MQQQRILTPTAQRSQSARSGSGRPALLPAIVQFNSEQYF
ncbi:hypothetical protein NC99_13020 [Sunxiuqinia dokdonensis]|uniref:Uncharacterized protein n=1 Tax=Sunxiuqinia dokdonensis TaxID=1409788 RepID=A0A0L8VBK6_9BACT|nr:hypothetical protein NC99_13020 [Sunxiuqinia dokdonensis]